MPHDKIRAAARERMTQTGQRYADARRAVVTGHRGEGEGQIPALDEGCALAMSGEIHDWLADLRDSDPAAARVVVQALAALMGEGARLGEPLVVSTADSWPWALVEALDWSYQGKVEKLTAVRRAEADAAALVNEIKLQAMWLRSAQVQLQDQRRRMLDAGRLEEAADALAAAARQEEQMLRLLPRVIEARRRLSEGRQRRQASTDLFRTRKESLKASFAAAHSSLMAYEAMAAGSTAEARLFGDVIAQIERELGHQAWPQGLMELQPTELDDTAVCILFAVEPPGTALLIAVLDGPEAVQDRRSEAILLSADMLRRVRAGQAPEAVAYEYANTRSFLEEFYPGSESAVG